LSPQKARDRGETLGGPTVAPGARDGLVDESQHSRNVAVLARLEEIDACADAKQPAIDHVPLVERRFELGRWILRHCSSHDLVEVAHLGEPA
jgi:hypothetical protein